LHREKNNSTVKNRNETAAAYSITVSDGGHDVVQAPPVFKPADLTISTFSLSHKISLKKGVTTEQTQHNELATMKQQQTIENSPLTRNRTSPSYFIEIYRLA
jgi:hypothetical protein